MFTENHMFLWIDSVTTEDGRHILDGLQFDDESGFGNSSQKWTGKAKFISKGGESFTDSLSISLAHFFSRGFRWTLPDNLVLPEPPFLVTSRLDTRACHRNAIVKISPYDLELKAGEELTVVSDLWCGVIVMGEFGSARATIFSSDSAGAAVLGDACLAETEEKVSLELLEPAQ